MKENDNINEQLEKTHIFLLLKGVDLDDILNVEREMFGHDLPEAIIDGYFPKMYITDEKDKDLIWNIYGQFERKYVPDLGLLEGD